MPYSLRHISSFNLLFPWWLHFYSTHLILILRQLLWFDSLSAPLPHWSHLLFTYLLQFALRSGPAEFHYAALTSPGFTVTIFAWFFFSFTKFPLQTSLCIIMIVWACWWCIQQCPWRKPINIPTYIVNRLDKSMELPNHSALLQLFSLGYYTLLNVI